MREVPEISKLLERNKTYIFYPGEKLGEGMYADKRGTILGVLSECSDGKKCDEEICLCYLSNSLFIYELLAAKKEYEEEKVCIKIVNGTYVPVLFRNKNLMLKWDEFIEDIITERW